MDTLKGLIQQRIVLPLLFVGGLFLSAMCLAVADDVSSRPSHIVTPAGTFFPQQDGRLLLFEGVHVFDELGHAVEGGIYGALYAMVTTPLVMGAIGFIPAAGPGPALAALATFLWKFRSPLSSWYSYMLVMKGMWNYRNHRVGQVPVYFSSRELSRRLLVSWHYPLSDERPLQLNIVALPGVHGTWKQEVLSPVEQGFQALTQAMETRKLARVVISLHEKKLVVSALPNQGGWFHRVMPRSVFPLLGESVYAWQGRRELSHSLTLFSPATLHHLVEALQCQDKTVHAWMHTAVKVADSHDVSLFELARDGNQCDFLEIADHSTRLGGWGGYMHVNIGQTCDEKEQLMGSYDGGYRENDFISRHHVSVVPRWLGKLMLRILSESISVGTKMAVDYGWEAASTPNSTESLTRVVPEKSASVKPILGREWLWEQADVQSVRCLSLLKPDISLPLSEEGRMICQWRIGHGH